MGLPNEFKPAYRYTVRDGQPSDCAELDAALLASRYVVYARAWQEQIPYIGSCKGTLRGRIQEHFYRQRNPDRQKGKGAAYWQWAEGKTITIFAFVPDQVSMLGRTFPVHLGLEHALIDEFNPPFVARR